MRLQVSAGGIALLLLAGCLGPAAPFDSSTSGWRIFDSAFDGLENARLVHTTPHDAFNLSWDGGSPYGHKAYYESALREGDTLRLAFRADAGPQVELTLRGEPLHSYRCDDAPVEPRPTNMTVDDVWANGYVLRGVGECVFHLTLRRDVVAENGVHLVWEGTTIAFDERDEGPGGGATLWFVAEREPGLAKKRE